MTQQAPNAVLSFDGGTAFRNKIINGCGWIDQRNANAPVTINSTANTFGPDRWAGFGQSADGVFALTGSRATFDPLAKGMPSCIIAQTSTIDSSIGASQAYGIRYCIEGQDVAPWRIGTAQAALATLSFRAYSTQVGTHCVALSNDANTRSYVATYTIAVANTWQTVVLPIQMDTTGSWRTDNGAGIKLFWNMGCGTSFNAPAANSWQTGQFFAVAGAQSCISTLNAGLAITDVQLELGGDATTYEQRSLQQEFALCQRYFETGRQPFFYASSTSLYSTIAYGDVRFAVTKRAAPTAVTATGWTYYNAGTGTAFTPSITTLLADGFQYQATGLTNWGGWVGAGTWTANAEL